MNTGPYDQRPLDPDREPESVGERGDHPAVRPLTIRVSKRGAVSVYGLGRFPVTLYGPQWHRLLAARNGILSFVAEHESLLRQASGK